MAAAITAVESGCRSVIVLEKRAVVGGNSGTGGGPGAIGGPVARRQGLEVSKDEFFKIAMEWAHWKTNPWLVRALIDKSGETIEWLEEKGLRFFPLMMGPTYHVPVGEGRKMMSLLKTRAEELGVRIFVRSGATRILTNDNGSVVGVEAQTRGKAFRVGAKSVIIATGGYGSNPELLRRYCGSYVDGMEYHGVPNTGDGLQMAIAVGAAIDNAGTMLLEGRLVNTNIRLPITRGERETIRVPLVSFAWEPYLLWVNSDGRRFVTEEARAFDAGNAVARQPGNLCFVLFDTAICTKISERGFRRGRPLPDAPAELQRGPLPGLPEALEAQAQLGAIKIAASWSEIAKWVGCDKMALETTVAEYNDACAHNYDPLFCKDRENLVPLLSPPYYAIRCASAFLDTIGGIKINERTEVMNTAGQVIPGLYAAGVVTGGWEGETYCFRLLGSARGFSLTAGRIAGANAAAYMRRS